MKTEAQKMKVRLRACYTKLLEVGSVQSFTDVSEVMGVPSSTVRSAFSAASSFLSETFLDKFVAVFPIFSVEWIRSGEGQMLRAGVHADTILSDDRFRWQRVQRLMQCEGLTYREFSDAIRINNYTTMYRIVRRGARPSDRTLERILRFFPHCNREWLMYGRGSMYTEMEELRAPSRNSKDEGSGRRSNAEVYVSPGGSMSFPLMENPAAAGRLLGFADHDPDTDGCEMSVLVDREYRGQYKLFRVNGISMDDGTILALADGDVVLGRRIDRQYWQYKLHTHDWLYFIFVTRSEGIVIKAIEHQDVERGIFTLRSLHPDYPDMEIRVEEITEIYNVIEVTRRSLRR